MNTGAGRRGENILLIGYRGAGKTAVGRFAAAVLGWRFVDCDERIEQTAGVDISEIFAREGEAGFRRREREALLEALAGEHQVIAGGGGIVLLPENRTDLRAGGLCIWLTASPEELWRRIAQDPRTTIRRPNLAGGGLAEVRSLLAKRRELYESVADHVVNTEGRSPEETARQVVALARGRFPSTDA